MAGPGRAGPGRGRDSRLPSCAPRGRSPPCCPRPWSRRQVGAGRPGGRRQQALRTARGGLGVISAGGRAQPGRTGQKKVRHPPGSGGSGRAVLAARGKAGGRGRELTRGKGQRPRRAGSPGPRPRPRRREGSDRAGAGRGRGWGRRGHTRGRRRCRLEGARSERSPPRGEGRRAAAAAQFPG